MELTCALVLLIVGLTTASPYGYGTKGGAAAKADASAVAGAYSGAREIPLSIPSGAGYSGSFANSYSSSSASSSASSSSSSFSYSGTGVVGGANGCGSANCNGEEAIGSQKSAAGSKAYSGANAGSLTGYGGQTHTGSYGHNHNSDGSVISNGQDCGSGACPGTDDSTINVNGAKASSQSVSDAKASAGAGAVDGQSCSGPDCNKSGSGSKCSTGECDQNNKCLTGNCDATSQIGSDKKHYEGSSSIDYENNDIHVKKSGTENSKLNYGISGSGCSNGKCGSSSVPESPIIPSYNKPAVHLTAPKFDAPCSGPNCQNKQNYSPTDEITSLCNEGNCDHSQTNAPFTSSNSQNVNQISQAANGFDALNKRPSDSQGSSVVCVPGNPGCDTPSTSSGPAGCASGNCGSYPSAPSYGVSSSIKPSYSSYAGKPSQSGCVTGNCGQYPSSPGIVGSSSIKSSYSQGTSPISSLDKHLDPSCIPGTPGCGLTPPSGPANCASGNCGTYPSAPSYGGSTKIKPSYSHSSSPSYSPGKPSSSPCAPGSPGCSVTPSFSSHSTPCAPGSPGCRVTPSFSSPSIPCAPGSPGCSVIPSFSSSPTPCAPGSPGCNITPSFSSPSTPCAPGSPGCSFNPSFSSPSTICAPGSPGCSVSPSFSSPSCPSGNCGKYPSIQSYDFSAHTNPSHSHSNSPSYSPGKNTGSPCAPGSPGCGETPSFTGPSDCTSGNCGAYPSLPSHGSFSSNRPSYSQGLSPSYSQGNPNGCAPGTPGCSTVSPVVGISDCASGKCGVSAPGYISSSIKPAYSPSSPVSPLSTACAPGSPGCSSLPLPSSPSGCTSGNCGPYPSSTGYGGAINIKPSYSYNSSPSYAQAKPSKASCEPGSPGCNIAPSGNGPSGCVSGNCGELSPSQGCSPGIPGCSGAPTYPGQSGTPSGHLGIGSSTSPLLNGLSGTGSPVPSYGAAGAGSSYNQGSFGSHGAGTYNKPNSGYSTGLSDSGAVPGIGSSYTGNVGATAGADSQQGTKKETPYTGGFGGPGGILKPNEYKAPTSYGSKPVISTGPTGTKPTCSSGICDQSGLASANQVLSGSASGAQASAEASADANAIAYTGGFGGPPGYLKPYDNGKADLKAGNQVPGSSHGASGIHSSYSNGGSQSGASAIAQANAAAVSSIGVSGDSKKHGDNSGAYGHGQEGGCGGGCGGSGGSNYGFSETQGHSKSGVLENSSNGSAAAGAIAKSVANASSGARSYGGSYASSSATAHASSGASVKGSYGRR